MNKGWIKLHRKLRDNPIYTNSKAVHVWIECLLRARHQEKTIYLKNKKVKLQAGMFVMGRQEFGKSIGMSGSTAWRWINEFKADSMLDIDTSSRGTIVTVINWGCFQKPDSDVNNKKTIKKQKKNTNNNVKKVNNGITGRNKTNQDEQPTLTSTGSVAKQPNKEHSLYKEFIQYFNEALNTKYKPIKARYTHFKARLKDGFTLEEMQRAIDNAKKNKFLMGDNDKNQKYLTPDYILRGDRLDYWLNSKKKRKTLEETRGIFGK